MLSICIPVHNYDITSLLRELGTQAAALNVPYEILVQNDCSSIAIINDSDLETDVIFELAESTINMGRHGSRMLLAEQASYQWLLFLDADVALPTALFLHNYIDKLQAGCPIIYGGVSYNEQEPSKDVALRWFYGRAREMRDVAKRNTDHYQNIISMGFAIKRSKFLKIGESITQGAYGQDILFSALIHKHALAVLHIDNPVTHLGLERNEVYLRKSVTAIISTVAFTKQGLIPSDFRPVQRAFLKLKRFKLVKLFTICMQLTENNLKNKLQAGSSSRLVYLDLLKLYAYCKTMTS
jgi:glycosyltransferase involved in cell wall biosynthesis